MAGLGSLLFLSHMYYKTVHSTCTRKESTLQYDDFTIYSVGQLFDPDTKVWPNGTMYSYHQDQHQLLLLFENIRPTEQLAVERGQTRFALYIEGDVIFLLARFDLPPDVGRGIAWNDAPYSWHLVPLEGRTLPPGPETIPEGLGALISIFLIEASTGIISTMRMVNLSHDFTKRLHQAIHEQAAKPFDPIRYMRQVQSVHLKYPSSVSMAEKALVACVGGLYEGA